MRIVCPGCKANFVVNGTEIGVNGVKYRCFRCKTVFRIVRKKQGASGRGAMAYERSGEVVKFVIAHESPAFCEAVKRVVAQEPFLAYDSNDGAEALAIIERVKPDVVLLDVALPTMYGFELCEAIRKNPDLVRTKIILLAAIYDKRRYRRDPSSMYGADEVIEKHRVPDELIPLVYSLIQSAPPVSGDAAPPAAAPAEKEPLVEREQEWLAAAAPPVATGWTSPAMADTMADAAALWPSDLEGDEAPRSGAGLDTAMTDDAPLSAAAEAEDLPLIEVEAEAEPLPESVIATFEEEITVEAGMVSAPAIVSPEGGDLPADHVKARRLARIIVSDIALYNPEKVAQGVKEGTLRTVLADEIAEGETLYSQRVAEEIRSDSNYLNEALEELIVRKKREYGD